MSTVQLLLCYSLQKGYTPIVRAADPQHLHDNIKAQEYVVSGEDMSSLDSWDEGEAGSLCMLYLTEPNRAAEEHSFMGATFRLGQNLR